MIVLAMLHFLDHVYLISSNASLEAALDLLQYPVLLVMAADIFRRKIPINKFLLMVAATAVFGISMVCSGSVTMLKYLLVLFYVQKCNQKKLYHKLFRIHSMAIMAVLILSVLGILPSTVVRRGYSTLGFSHSNMLAANVFSCLCCYVLSRPKKLSGRQYILLILCIVAVYFLTDSRTSVLCMAGFVAVLFALERCSFLMRRGLSRTCIVSLPVVLAVLSWWAGMSRRTGSAFIMKLDELLSWRLTLADNFMQVLTPQLWGQRVTMNLVENTYLVCMYKDGIIPLLVMCLLIALSLKKNMKRRDAAKVACMIGFLIHGLTEVTAFNPFFNVTLLTKFFDIRRDCGHDNNFYSDI